MTPSLMANQLESLLTSKDVGEVLGIHTKVVERMAKRGEVPALRVGRFWRYRAPDLESWVGSKVHSICQPCRTATSF